MPYGYDPTGAVDEQDGQDQPYPAQVPDYAQPKATGSAKPDKYKAAAMGEDATGMNPTTFVEQHVRNILHQQRLASVLDELGIFAGQLSNDPQAVAIAQAHKQQRVDDATGAAETELWAHIGRQSLLKEQQDLEQKLHQKALDRQATLMDAGPLAYQRAAGTAQGKLDVESSPEAVAAKEAEAVAKDARERKMAEFKSGLDTAEAGAKETNRLKARQKFRNEQTPEEREADLELAGRGGEGKAGAGGDFKPQAYLKDVAHMNAVASNPQAAAKAVAAESNNTLVPGVPGFDEAVKQKMAEAGKASAEYARGTVSSLLSGGKKGVPDSLNRQHVATAISALPPAEVPAALHQYAAKLRYIGANDEADEIEMKADNARRRSFGAQ